MMPKQPETKVKFSIFNKEFNDGLREIDNESKKLRKEFKLQEEQLKENGSASDILSNKINRLSTEQEQTRKKIKATEEQLANAKKYYGDNSKEAETLANKLLDLRISEQKLQNAIKNTKDDLKKQGKAMDDTAKDAQELKDSIKDAANGMAGIGTGTAIGAGALVNGMQEYNEILARLKTNAATSGRDLGVVEDAFNRIVTVTGEADSAGETIANLLASGLSDEQLKNSIDEITGAYITFSDTLKTEGIADGLQETLATGQAVGPFAELLERSGVNIDHFNSTLSSMKAVGKDTDYVMQTLADLGLSKTYDKYKELNPEVQQNAEANAQLQQASADLAIVLTPLVAKVTEIVSKVTKWASENPTLTKTILIIVTVIGILIGIFLVLAPVLTTVSIAAGALNIAMLPMTGIILGIMAAIAAIIAIGVLLYKNWDKVSSYAVNLWKKLGPIKIALLALTGPIGALVAAGVLLYKNWDAIKEKAGALRDKLVNLFKGFDWKLPKIKLPHFSVTGKFDLVPPKMSLPKVNVSWHRTGGVFTDPVIAGNAGFGDVEEGIVPFEGSHAMKIARLIAAAQNKIAGVANGLASKALNNLIQVNVEAGDVLMDSRPVGQLVWRTVQEEIDQDKERNDRAYG